MPTGAARAVIYFYMNSDKVLLLHHILEYSGVCCFTDGITLLLHVLYFAATNHTTVPLHLRKYCSISTTLVLLSEIQEVSSESSLLCLLVYFL